MSGAKSTAKKPFKAGLSSFSGEQRVIRFAALLYTQSKRGSKVVKKGRIVFKLIAVVGALVAVAGASYCALNDLNPLVGASPGIAVAVIGVAGLT